MSSVMNIVILRPPIGRIIVVVTIVVRENARSGWNAWCDDVARPRIARYTQHNNIIIVTLCAISGDRGRT